MPTLDLDGLTISYGDSGDGPVLVLLHAAGSTGAQWRGVSAALGTRFRILTPDLWGHGKTSFWPDPEGLRHDHQADLVGRMIDAARTGSVDLVGHSYGGAGAIRLTLEHPERVRSLVLIEPMMACFLRELGETAALDELEGIQNQFRAALAKDGPEAAWQGFLDFRNGPGTWAGYEEKTRQNFVRRTAAQIANFNANQHNRTRVADLARIATPTLVVRGSDTSLYDKRMSEIAAGAIPGARFLVLEGAGHMSPLSHPERVAAEIETHVAAAEAAAD